MVLFQDGDYQNAPEKPLKISGEQSKVMVSIIQVYQQADPGPLG
jgi:hypothetical protein